MNDYVMTGKKIVWWIDHLGFGGTQKFLTTTVLELAPFVESQAVVVVNNVVDSNLRKMLLESKIEIRIIGKFGLFGLFGLFTTWIWLSIRRFDVAVTLLYYSDILGTILSSLAGVGKIISSQRSSNKHYGKGQIKLIRFCLESVDSIVLNSESSRSDIERYIPIGKRLCVIPNGIDCLKYGNSYVHTNVRDELDLDSDSVLLGYVGRLSEEKGVDLLIDSISMLDRPRVRVLLIGEGPAKENLMAQIQNLGLGSQIHVLGHRRDVPSLLKQFNIYIQPSRFEGMPLAVLEAMASGCAVVASAVDGIRDIVVDGKTGWLVSTERPEEFAMAIEYALDHPQETRQIGINAKKFVTNNYSAENSRDLWLEELTRLTQN